MEGWKATEILATLIAKRNFNRTKTNSYANKKGAQKKFIASSLWLKQPIQVQFF
jgi:hypothetical protein